MSDSIDVCSSSRGGSTTLRSSAIHGPGRHALEGLLDDAHRLAHLVHVHLVAVVDIAVRPDGNVEVDVAVGEVGRGLAQVPVDPGGAQHRPRLAERDRVLGGEQPDALRPCEPDRVLGEHRLVLVDRLRHHLAELAALREEAARDVLGESADLEVARVHARAGDELEEVEHPVALAERVPEGRDRSQLERGRAEPDEVRVDAVQLGEQRPHPDRLRRHLDAEQLLDRHHERELVRLERDVVHARRVRDRLPPGLLLHRLLEARVEVADDRLEADDGLAVQLEDEPEHAVHGRVVGAEVDLEDVRRAAELLGHLDHRRDRRGDARSLVDAGGCDGHQTSSEKRTGSPPIG